VWIITIGILLGLPFFIKSIFKKRNSTKKFPNTRLRLGIFI
jgi:hypothetical protein